MTEDVHSAGSGESGVVSSLLAPGQKPNIVLIIADDIGYPHYGFMGHPRIKTPAMDSLVTNGVLFPVAYNSGGMCVPSLESILVGRYQKDFHVSKKSGYGEDYLSVPIALRRAGYVSYQAGKFWSGQKNSGFDQWLNNGRDKIGRDTMQPIFDFIDERLTTDRKPWVVWYAPRLPHRPLSSPKYYEDRQLPFPYADVPDRDDAHFYGNISWLDDTIAELVDGLERRGLRENTLLLYAADNGWMLPHSKHNLTENGIRTVMWANMPGTVSAGVRRSELAHTIDILPTLMDFAGLPIPADLQGRSLKPLLQLPDATPVTPWRDYLFGHNYASSSTHTRVSSRYVRTKDGFIYYPELGALYNLNVYPNPDLAKDKKSEFNLVNNPQYAGLVAQLKAAVDAWAPVETSGGKKSTARDSVQLAAADSDCRKGAKWVFIDKNDDGCFDRADGDYPMTWGELSKTGQPWRDERGRLRLRINIQSSETIVFPEQLEELTAGVANVALFVTSSERIYVYSKIFGRKTPKNIESLSLNAASDIIVGPEATIAFTDSVELISDGGDMLILEGSSFRTSTASPDNHILLKAPEGEVDVHSVVDNPTVIVSDRFEIAATCSHVDESALVQARAKTIPHHCY
jgi:arylsulfatase A-like enzyme